jgi:tetratricopeptide (TPR) repeat protein
MRTKTIPSIILSSIVFLLFVPPVLAGVSDQLQQADNLFKNKQYDQAEQIYLSIAQQNIPEALQAQKNLISLYIKENKDDKADAAYTQLLARFSGQKDIAEALWKIGIMYDQAGKFDKAIEVHKYNVEHFANDINAVFSQVEIVKSYLRRENETAADASVSNFLTTFTGQPTLPKGIYHIARRYDEFKKYDKAVNLHQYNVEHFPDDIHAIWSQAEIIFSYIRDGSDDAADAAFDKLLTVFANQPTLSNEIYQVARRYNKAGKTQKSLSLDQYNVKRFPNDIHAMWSQVEIIFSHIRDANEPAANAAFDELLTIFSDQPTLSKEVYQVAHRYRRSGNDQKAYHLYQYLIERWSSVGDLNSRKVVVMSYISLGDDAGAQTAIEVLTKDFKNDPNLSLALWQAAEAYYNEAFKYAKEDRDERAKEYFSNVIKIGKEFIEKSPDSATAAEAHHILAICYERLGEYIKAIEHYQTVVDRWPEDKHSANAQFLVAHCLNELAISGLIPKSDASSLIQDACGRLLVQYPNSSMVDAADDFIKYWESLSETGESK